MFLDNHWLWEVLTLFEGWIVIAVRTLQQKWTGWQWRGSRWLQPGQHFWLTQQFSVQSLSVTFVRYQKYKININDHIWPIKSKDFFLSNPSVGANRQVMCDNARVHIVCYPGVHRNTNGLLTAIHLDFLRLHSDKPGLTRLPILARRVWTLNTGCRGPPECRRPARGINLTAARCLSLYPMPSSNRQNKLLAWLFCRELLSRCTGCHSPQLWVITELGWSSVKNGESRAGPTILSLMASTAVSAGSPLPGRPRSSGQ